MITWFEHPKVMSTKLEQWIYFIIICLHNIVLESFEKSDIKMCSKSIMLKLNWLYDCINYYKSKDVFETNRTLTFFIVIMLVM